MYKIWNLCNANVKLQTNTFVQNITYILLAGNAKVKLKLKHMCKQLLLARPRYNFKKELLVWVMTFNRPLLKKWNAEDRKITQNFRICWTFLQPWRWHLFVPSTLSHLSYYSHHRKFRFFQLTFGLYHLSKPPERGSSIHGPSILLSRFRTLIFPLHEIWSSWKKSSCTTIIPLFDVRCSSTHCSGYLTKMEMGLSTSGFGKNILWNSLEYSYRRSLWWPPIWYGKHTCFCCR